MDNQQSKIDARIKQLNEQRSDTEISIRLSWAVNNAVEVLKNKIWYPLRDEGELTMDNLVDFFLNYFDQKKAKMLNAYEVAYKKNPAPTVAAYEAMPQSQKAFLKDQQLAGNRKAYAERKETCGSCGGTASMGSVDNPLVNGMHEKCRISENYKFQNNK